MADYTELFVSNSFHLEMDGETVATFKEVDGIESETDVAELVQAGPGGKLFKIKTQGGQSFKMGKVTAKYATFEGDKILDWVKDIQAGKMTRKNISIVIFTHDDTEAARFVFHNAWPSKYSWSGVSATGNEPIVATVVFEHERMDLPK